MRTIVRAWVPGHPRTKGSLTFRGRHPEEAPGVDEWRAKIASAVKRAMAGRPAEAGPVAVVCRFFLEPPPGAPQTSSVLRRWLAATWNRAGDVDKLARCVLDACGTESDKPQFNGGAYVNDNQVVTLIVYKVPSNGNPGDSGLLLEIVAYDELDTETLKDSARLARQETTG